MDSFQGDSLSVEEVAAVFAVSLATVRNWIKTGYLVATGRDRVLLSSFRDFKDNIAGQEKLVARANKLLRDSHDHAALSEQVLEQLGDGVSDSAEIGLFYERSLSNSYRNREGVYYTPEDIVSDFFSFLPADLETFTFCDPCCGSGNFIVAALDHGVRPENVFGFDVDPVAVEITRKRIFEKSGYRSENIRCEDFLGCSAAGRAGNYDLILTNPPWGKKLARRQKHGYAQTFDCGRSVDTSSLFVCSCLASLSPDGYLGFLLQDAFFNIASYADVRRRVLEKQVVALLDFGKPFKGILARAVGLIVKNSAYQHDTMNRVSCRVKSAPLFREQQSFCDNPKAVLNYRVSGQEAAAITQLYALPHVTLADRARWGLGIVTGSNRKFVKKNPQAGYMPVYRGTDISKEGLADSSAYIPDELSLYQQVAPRELYQADCKLVYRFISSDLVFFCDERQRFFLNSANFLVPDDDFPLAMPRLCQLLNSRVLNWLFHSLFATHKVLRSDLETLPLHLEYFKFHDQFDDALFAAYLGLEEFASGRFRIAVTQAER